MTVRQRVVVLHSRQPITTDLAASFPAEEFDVVVLTDAVDGPVIREGTPGTSPETLRLPRDRWSEQVRTWAGGVPQVITNDEYCLTACAGLRDELGLPARHPVQLDGYLDKVRMKRVLHAAGVAVPRFTAFEPVVTDDRDTVRRLLDEVGVPAVAKPRQEANSRGVSVLRTADELSDWLTRHAGQAGWQLDAFVDGTLHHVNALVRDGVVYPVMAGTYLGPLLGVSVGRTLGGRTIPATDPLADAAHELNRRVVAALGGAGAFVVHTEFARTASGELLVLEVAARAPGALLPSMALKHAGVELEEANLRLQAGLATPTPEPTGVQAAWLWPAVMPGRRYAGAPPFAGAHDVHVRAVGRNGNTGDEGAIGASVLLWNADDTLLSADVTLGTEAVWFA
ncbi:ATP-grasp domain-containing protein [Krasilnikovia cinnamomea]|uniref:ATP-grasp domain-containing protein n=1 Tax=Krasilnikovia cinnamomea TaxID=349313 RepID=A0A4Q7ZL21_9ACTN|nr:ATP-grasp domain-containing protein [Krasilnikovia cinnamomea]RZU51650.1 ATP-grasp domain-containing protein [Krasilnikovia cinnamomea]